MSSCKLNKTISIIIPAFNSEKYIFKAIESVISNNYNPDLYEIIVIDDGSTDNTKAVVKSYCEKYSNIHFYSKTNGNWGSVINYAKKNKLVKYDYVIILDSDDLLKKNFFKLFNKKIKDACVLMCAIYIKGKFFKYHTSPYWFLNRNIKKIKNRFTMSFAPLSVIFKTDLFYQTIDLVEYVSYQDSLLVYDALSKAKVVRYTACASGTYWKTRPGNTMTSVWSDKRINDEIILHKKMEEINLEQTMVWRIFMWGFAKKAKQIEYKISMRKIPKPDCLPWIIRWLYWIIYFFYLRKFIKIS